MSKSLLESTDNNSNTVNTTLTVFFPCNTPLCPNFDIDVSLLNEEIDSLEIFFDTQFQNLRQTSSVKSNDKGKSRNNESNISIESFQNKIYVSKMEFINKKISIKKTSHLTHAIYPFRIKNLENNTDHIDLENEIFGSRTFTVTLIAPT